MLDTLLQMMRKKKDHEEKGQTKKVNAYGILSKTKNFQQQIELASTSTMPRLDHCGHRISVHDAKWKKLRCKVTKIHEHILILFSF